MRKQGEKERERERERGIKREREQSGEKERLPECTSKLCLDVDVEWALMVSEGKRLHEKKEKERK